MRSELAEIAFIMHCSCDTKEVLLSLFIILNGAKSLKNGLFNKAKRAL